MHLLQIGYRGSSRKLLSRFNSERTKRDPLNVEMLWWLRTYTQNPVLLALSHAWSRRDGAGSHWIGLNLSRKSRQLFLASFWLCAFPNLAYWIFSFCLWGLFALLDLMGQWADKRGVRRRGANTCCPTVTEGHISLLDWELDSSIHTHLVLFIVLCCYRTYYSTYLSLCWFLLSMPKYCLRALNF